jgi:hypothetical protein
MSKVGFGASTDMYTLVLLPRRTSTVPAMARQVWVGHILASRERRVVELGFRGGEVETMLAQYGAAPLAHTIDRRRHYVNLVR